MSEDEDNIIHVDFGGSGRADDEGDETVDGGSAPEQASPPLASGTGAEKLRIFSDLLEEGTVMVTLDSRREGVVVPEPFAGQFRLSLNFDYLFRIPDFSYDEEGVRASLSFGGVDKWCDIPWSAVYMMQATETTDVVLFPAQLPPEMMAIIPEIERAIREHEGEHDDSAELAEPSELDD